MSSFDVIVLGVGDAFSARHVNASLLLEAEGFHLAIDCPDRYAGVVARASEQSGRSLDLESIDHMLITHLHGDHVNGLEGFDTRSGLIRPLTEGEVLHV